MTRPDARCTRCGQPLMTDEDRKSGLCVACRVTDARPAAPER